MIITSVLKNRALHKSLALFGALFLCVMSGACLTMQLYQGTKAPLKEEINGFFLNPEQLQIVFMGKQHHYVFPLDDQLQQILMWSGHRMLNTSNLSFVISRDDSIKGTYSLSIPATENPSAEDQQFLLNHGFQQQRAPIERNNSTPVKIKTAERLFASPNAVAPSHQMFIYHGSLNYGKVYAAGKFVLPQAQMLRDPLQLSIRYDYASTGQVIGRTLLTPFSVAADGVSIAVGAVVLIPAVLISGVVKH